MGPEFWNQRYGESGYAYGTEPNTFLSEQASLFQPGTRVLAVGDGEGRNGVWLARQGSAVLSVDASAVGLTKARALAKEAGLVLDTVCVDLNTWDWPVARFDVVVAIFVHFPPEQRSGLHRAMLSALKPGGRVIMEAFTPAQLGRGSGGPPVAEMLYTPAQMRSDFATADIELLEEREVVLAEGAYHCGPAAVLRLLARQGQG